MKYKLSMLLTLFMLINISCSSSNPVEEIIIPETPTTYMPLKDGNYWNYDVQQVNAGAINSSLGIDHLYVSNDTLISGVTFKKMKTTNNANGFFSRTLKNNGVKISGSSLIATGKFSIPFPGLTTPIEINLNNFAFFKDNAPIGTEIGITSGTLQQTVNNYPLDINYTLKAVAQESLPNYTSNNVTYNNVKKTRLLLNLKISTTNSGVTAILLADQTVFTINEYFAKNIGNVYTNTYFHYEINPDIATQFGVPPTASETQEEFLTTYLLN